MALAEFSIKFFMLLGFAAVLAGCVLAYFAVAALLGVPVN